MIRTLILAATLALCGCATGPQPREPDGTLEEIERADLAARKASASITNLTCTQFVMGKCVEPGKSFDPDTGIKYQGEVQEIRRWLRQAGSIGAGSVGLCMGVARTQEQCLAAARSLLADLERRVLEAQAQGGR